MDSRHVDGLEVALVQAREAPQVENELLNPAEPQLHGCDPVARFLRPAARARPPPAASRQSRASSLLDRSLMRQDEGEGIVDLVGDACDEFAEGGHLGGLDELGLRVLQEVVRLLELAVGLGQRLRRGGFRPCPREGELPLAQLRLDAPVLVLHELAPDEGADAHPHHVGLDRRGNDVVRRLPQRRGRACRRPPRCRGRRWRRSGRPCRAAGARPRYSVQLAAQLDAVEARAEQVDQNAVPGGVRRADQPESLGTVPGRRHRIALVGQHVLEIGAAGGTVVHDRGCRRGGRRRSSGIAALPGHRRSATSAGAAGP